MRKHSILSGINFSPFWCKVFLFFFFCKMCGIGLLKLTKIVRILDLSLRTISFLIIFPPNFRFFLHLFFSVLHAYVFLLLFLLLFFYFLLLLLTFFYFLIFLLSPRAFVSQIVFSIKPLKCILHFH